MMNKIMEMRTFITAFLKSKHPNVIIDGKSKSRVFFEQAPDDAVMPYLVFDLPNSNDDGSMEQFFLDVDGWDAPANGDTTALETLMSNIDGDGDKSNPTGLHRKTVSINASYFIMPTFPSSNDVSELSMTFYRENRFPLRDDDKRIRRRKYVYQVRTHGSN